MAGEAKTTALMLGTATVMLGDPVDLFNFAPSTHSIGLVKNFNLTVDQSYTELTQGVQNQVVFSVKTGNKVMATMEAYEYTGKNLTYALGMEGFSAAAEVTASTTVVSATLTDLTVISSTGITAGNYIKIQTGTNDRVFIRKVVNVNVSGTPPVHVITVAALPSAPAQGATVAKMNVIPLSPTSSCNDTFVAAKIVGTLADCSEVVILLPKVKVTKGFNLAFNSNDFQNMPLELTVYDLLSSDDHYAAFAEFGNTSSMLLTPK